MLFDWGEGDIDIEERDAGTKHNRSCWGGVCREDPKPKPAVTVSHLSPLV